MAIQVNKLFNTAMCASRHTWQSDGIIPHVVVYHRLMADVHRPRVLSGTAMAVLEEIGARNILNRYLQEQDGQVTYLHRASGGHPLFVARQRQYAPGPRRGVLAPPGRPVSRVVFGTGLRTIAQPLAA